MKAYSRSGSPVSHERWLVSYADFVTLLFAFFVVLYASARIDQKKAARLSGAIEAAFQQLGAFQNDPRAPASTANMAVSVSPGCLAIGKTCRRRQVQTLSCCRSIMTRKSLKAFVLS